MGRIFASEKEFYEHFVPFFRSLSTHADFGPQVQQGLLSFRIVSRDPQAEVSVDSRNGEEIVTTGPGLGLEDVRIQLTAESLHGLLLGKIKLMPAIMARQVAARGTIDKQKQLATFLDAIPQAYKDYLTSLGKESLIS